MKLDIIYNFYPKLSFIKLMCYIDIAAKLFKLSIMVLQLHGNIYRLVALTPK